MSSGVGLGLCSKSLIVIFGYDLQQRLNDIVPVANRGNARAVGVCINVEVVTVRIYGAHRGIVKMVGLMLPATVKPKALISEGFAFPFLPKMQHVYIYIYLSIILS